MSTYLDAEDVKRAMDGRWEEAYCLYTPLKQKGEHLCGPCPIHKGEGPNFKVEAATGLWYCHSQCQRGGDIFDFTQAMYACSFQDAVDAVARWAGMTVPPPPPRPAEKFYRPIFEAPTEKTPAQEAARWVCEEYAATAHATLMDDAELLAWLRVYRGLTVETLKRFEIGVISPELPRGSQRLIWPRITFPVRDRDGHLTNIRKHLFAFEPNLDRAKHGKTLPWASGLPADLFPLAAVWGKEEAPPPQVWGAGLGAERRSAEAGTFPTPAPQTWGGGASPPSAARPIHQRTIDLADVPAPPADLPFLWGPYLNEGASHWLTGKTGLGKSTFAFNLACALAEGRTLWGIECRARRLLYVDLESGDIGRALKVQRLYGDRPRQSGRLTFVREPMRLPDESAELCAYADIEKFDLVIFDTARRVFAVKDENDNAEVYNRIIPTLDALKARGVATLTMGLPPKTAVWARGARARRRTPGT